MSEYWHSGFLEKMDVFDVGKDGSKEILLAGVNNGYGAATLVVLDPRNIGGASRQPPGDPSQLQGFDTGREKAVLFFPRSCINKKFQWYNFVAALHANNETIRVEVGETPADPDSRVTFVLNQNLEVKEVLPTDRFKTLHRELWLAGKLDHEFSPEESAEFQKVSVIRNGVR